MSKILKSISEEDFKEKIHIRFNNILNGLDTYSNGLLEYGGKEKSFEEKEEDFINFFNELFELEEGEVIVDFYIKNLDKESKNRLLENLEGDDKEILKNHIESDDINSVFFECQSKELMSFITKLNTRELFFCTVYLRKVPMTIWGNYNLSFPMFFKEKDVLEIYKDLAKKNNLEVRGVVIK
ncbi:hypothetical protein [Clostridium sp. LIBA-8841]|uniref:hypothetical protein n=1 Tax=Clostridium sp. LIBA-8841 TaxID=2987530 RepID=UPI002AC4F185|nr:hypothetical protein [Clostridium sp. LIBA-8841]MDZ5252418.1 hypothetical protein [Clostridium sp. LIBA-8841]